MKQVKVSRLPKCDCCVVEDARYDVPTKHGPWGSLCQECKEAIGAPNADDVGHEYVIREQPNKNGRKNEGRKVTGVELNSPEEVLMGDVDREIECPECKGVRVVEPDADYEFTCDDCGARVQCPEPVL